MIEEELPVRRIQVGVLPLVLPGEMPAHPDVGESLTAGALGRALFEAVPGSVRVGLGRSRLAEHAAEINEMLLSRQLLLEPGGTPLGHELLRGHAPAVDDALRHVVTPLPVPQARRARLYRIRRYQR